MLDARATLDGLTPRPGSYLLHINIPNEFLGTIGSLGSIILPPGDYIYLGSARGPGGISKRVARHCRAEKKTFWHVDYLTKAGQVRGIGVCENISECALTGIFLTWPEFQVPIPGFGSTDCKQCKAHFLGFNPSNRSNVSNKSSEIFLSAESANAKFLIIENSS